MRFSFSVGETRSKGGAAATKKNNICKRFGPRKYPMLISSTFILKLSRTKKDLSDVTAAPF